MSLLKMTSCVPEQEEDFPGRGGRERDRQAGEAHWSTQVSWNYAFSPACMCSTQPKYTLHVYAARWLVRFLVPWHRRGA